MKSDPVTPAKNSTMKSDPVTPSFYKENLDCKFRKSQEVG